MLCALCTLGTASHALADTLWWKGGAGLVNGADFDRWTNLPGIFNLGGTNFTTDSAGTTRTLSTLPTATTDLRFLTSTPVSDECLLGRDFTINSLIVNTTPTNINVFIGKDAGTNHTLTLASPGVTLNNTGTLQLACNLNVTNTTSLAINVSSTTGTVAATGTILAPALVKSGTGKLGLGDPLTATGPSSNSFTSLIVNDGNVEAFVQNTIPVGCNLTVNSGSITLDNTPTTVGNIVFGNGASGTTRTVRQSALSFPPVPTLTVQGDIAFNGPGDPAVLTTPIAFSAGQHLITNPNGFFSNSFFDIVIDGPVSGPGGYTKSGNAYMVLTEPSTHTGATIIEGGRLYAASSGALSQSSPLTVNAPGQLSLNPLISALVTAGNYSQTVPSLSGNGSILLGSANLTVATTTTSTFAGVISGTGGLVKNGPGTLILSGNNTYTTPTNIGNGLLQLGDGGASGTVAGDIVNNAVLAFNRSDTFNFTPIISGPGSLTKAGPGTLVLTAAHTYSGGTTISGGTLQIGNGGTTGSIPGNITNNANLTFNRSNSVPLSIVVSGNGTLTKLGAGTLFLIGNNTYTGATTVTQGTLQIGNGGFTGTVAGNINNNAALIVDRATSLTLPGRISGTGTLTKVGAGTLTLAPNQALPHLQSNLTILSGSINLTNNDLLLNYTGSSPIATLIAYLNSGQLTATGDFNGLPTTLAISEAADLGLATFGGIVIDDTTVIAKYTFVGDANLDGQVDALDYERVDLAIGNTGALGTAQGDLNYDGNVDALDYEQIDLNIGNGVGTPLANVFIPEPSSLALLSLPVLTLTSRRRR